ncbi:hypothetical protein CH370_18775 [Leptospira kmetyi]|uniref:hypothetical protein n=1 Tax=Leptospira kmetyi TaxID=408139 RepID=UPI000C2AB098|nr:hypothetical protein [Leptospira kmetyi]PJZ39969.1 hypothetical protein CH370_18775 [Leptospira kmetyi]
MEKEKWYQQRKYQIGIGILLLLTIVGLFSGDEKVEKADGPKEYKATSFYDSATDIEQHGSTIYVTFAPSLDGTGYTKEQTAGILNVSFRWSGYGVPSGKTANVSVNIVEDQYKCAIFCEAKVTLEVPNAFIGPGWLDTTIELIPTGRTKGFKTSKKIATL